MKLIRTITWSEVFEKWQEREASNPGWIECATKVKGWPSWEAWRSFTAEQIDASNRNWQLYEFDDPMNEVPAMLLGPYSSWQDGVVNKNQTTFKELLKIPEQYNRFKNHPGVLSILAGLPFETELIGLVRKDNNQIVCLEGHHRATAISLTSKNGQEIDFSNSPVRIALAEIESDECLLFDELLKRGTLK